MSPLLMIGPTEVWVILGVVLLVFGSRKLPELARAMGNSISQFKRGLADEPAELEPGKRELDPGRRELDKGKPGKDQDEDRA